MTLVGDVAAHHREMGYQDWVWKGVRIVSGIHTSIEPLPGFPPRTPHHQSRRSKSLGISCNRILVGERRSLGSALTDLAEDAGYQPAWQKPCPIDVRRSDIVFLHLSSTFSRTFIAMVYLDERSTDPRALCRNFDDVPGQQAEPFADYARGAARKYQGMPHVAAGTMYWLHHSGTSDSDA
jgi:hypothetical protein